jgi:hypothetical protein
MNPDGTVVVLTVDTAGAIVVAPVDTACVEIVS